VSGIISTTPSPQPDSGERSGQRRKARLLAVRTLADAVMVVLRGSPLRPSGRDDDQDDMTKGLP
jgi:hypothetical protein